VERNILSEFTFFPVGQNVKNLLVGDTPSSRQNHASLVLPNAPFGTAFSPAGNAKNHSATINGAVVFFTP